MSQTTEDRIRLQYKARRRSRFVHEYGVSALWMGLARQWKRPVQEIKRICMPNWSPEAARAKYEAQLQRQAEATRFLERVRAAEDNPKQMELLRQEFATKFGRT